MKKPKIQIEYVEVSKLKNHDRNPRKIEAAQFKILCDSIKEAPDYFEVRPILCNKKMVVFAGNQRLRAAVKLGLKEVPAAVMNVSPAKQKELMLKDNINNGEWDIELLTAEYETQDLVTAGLNLEGLGIYTDTGFGEEVKLPNGERKEFCQITFTLATEQAEVIKNALEDGMHIAEEYDHLGNKNKNGNALYAIIQEWRKLKT